MNWDTELEKVAAKTKYPIGDGDHGAIKPACYQDHGVPYIRVADITWESQIVRSKMVYIPQEVNEANPKSFLYPGDIVISKTGATIGKVAIIPDDIKIANTTASIGKVTLDTDLAIPKYVLWCMKSHQFQTQMWRVSHKSAQPGFNVKDLKKFKIPLPPLDQQKKIAAILDAADAYRQKTKALIEKYDALTQSLFLDMFGDPVSNPKGWESSKLGLIVENKDSKRKPVKSSDRENMDGDYPYYGASGIIDYVNWFTHEGDNLLIGEDGANLLARSKPIAFIAKGQYWVNNHAHVLGCNGKALLVFIEFFINLIDLSNYVTGSAQPKLNRKNMDQIKIFCPPIELQNQFADSVQAIEGQKGQAQASLAQAEDLFNSLLQRAFKGELV